jgi:hypothetical protein
VIGVGPCQCRHSGPEPAGYRRKLFNEVSASVNEATGWAMVRELIPRYILPAIER